MSLLKPGTRCIIIAGCPENIGLIVEVIWRFGEQDGSTDAYYIKTISGRKFHPRWHGNDLHRGASDECITDRRKLRPLVDPKVEANVRKVEVVML